MPAFDLDGITAETLEAVKKAQTSGVSSGTGITGIDLAGLVSLIPVETPLRNLLPRVGSKTGAKFAQWRALLNINNSQPDISVAFDYAGAEVLISEQDISAAYQPIALAGITTQDAVDLAGGYADARAVTSINVLNQLMIGEEKKLGVGGCAFALPTIATPSVTPSATGGTIAATTAVNVKVAARSGRNYFYGGSGVASAQGTGTTGSGSSNSAVASVAAVKGAVAYDWYVSGFYYTTTPTNTVTITSIPTANAALPTNLPDLSSVAPTAAPTVDTSAGANDFNSMLSTILGDYGAPSNGIVSQVTPGSGTANGSYWRSLDGNGFTLSGGSITELDELNQAIYDNIRLSPTEYMFSASDSRAAASLVLGSPSAVTYLQPNDQSGRADVVAGGFVGWYLNKSVGGKAIRAAVYPEIPPGTMIARTDSVPFPGSGITNVFEVETLRDYAEFPYAAARVANTAGGGPREEFEIRAIELLKNAAPPAQGVLQNIGSAL